MFQKKGYVVVPTEGVKEDELMDIAISAGAEDIQEEEGAFMVYTTPEAFDDVVKALQDAKVPMEDSKVGKFPQTYVTLAGKEAQQMLRLVSALEDHDDVENVWNNADISEEEMEKFSE
ncbi:MAG: putative transcriptional regulatory protein [Candidatus Aminicenantes bacterium ADurb.Bin508]|nr:MAG: putative transcriptional regulatory protein [Candidatus Aminicenantes bacterium ADurb.Bin508]